VLGVPVLVAFVVPENEGSRRILHDLAFRDDGLIDHPAFAEPVEKFVLGESAVD
jgi:RimJ/RimL family protein N-acetyltransferase